MEYAHSLAEVLLIHQCVSQLFGCLAERRLVWCDTSHGSKTLLQALLGPPRDGAFGVVTAQLCYAQLGCSRPGTGQ